MVVLIVGIVTFAILVHELGHAVTGRLFGLQPAIAFHAMGGLTQFGAKEHRELSHGRRVLITLAGPMVGILIGIPIFFLPVFVPIARGSVADSAHEIALWTTLGWGVLNLIPMMPLDGGQIVATILDRFFGTRGILIARIASMVIGVGLAAVAIAKFDRPWFTLLILANLAMNNWRAYQAEKNWQKDAPLQQAIKEAYAALEAGDPARVRQLAEALREQATTPISKGHVSHLLAWAHLMEGDATRARQALEMAPAGHRHDAFLEGSVLIATKRPSEAIGPLREALEDRGDDEVADALAEALCGAGRVDEIVALLEARGRSERVGVAAFQRIAHRLFTRGQYTLAAELYRRTFERFGVSLDAFNAACAYVRNGDEERALRMLREAVDVGLPDPSILETDEDLEPLRGRPELDELRRRAKGKA
jgi:tetratricopeptide (TPR) repeat protein